MRFLLLAFLVGCGEVSPAGVSLEDGGAAGAMAGTGGGAAGAGGDTGAGGQGGAGGRDVVAEAARCALITRDSFTGTYSAQKTYRNPDNSTACLPLDTFAVIDHGDVSGWDRYSYYSNPSTAPGHCDVMLGFTRVGGPMCGMEIMRVFLTVPTI